MGTLAVCSDNYGYGTLQVPNATHLHWQWLETGPGNHSSKPGTTHDDFWLVRDTHLGM